MFRGVVSIQQNNLDPMLAKILIMEMKNSAQLAYHGIDYSKVGLCYPVYGGKKTSILRNGCEVFGKEKQ